MISDISKAQVSDSDTRPRPALTNLRVTGQAVEDANVIAGALGLTQRATVEGLLKLVRGMVDAEQAKGASLDKLRRAVFGGMKVQ